LQAWSGESSGRLIEGSLSLSGDLYARLIAMPERFKVGDEFSWNSEASRASGLEDFAHLGAGQRGYNEDGYRLPI